MSVRTLCAEHDANDVHDALARLQSLGLLMVEAGNVLCLALRNDRGTAPDWEAIRGGAIRPRRDTSAIETAKPSADVATASTPRAGG